jgi:hypothetical protein
MRPRRSPKSSQRISVAIVLVCVAITILEAATGHWAGAGVGMLAAAIHLHNAWLERDRSDKGLTP